MKIYGYKSNSHQPAKLMVIGLIGLLMLGMAAFMIFGRDLVRNLPTSALPTQQESSLDESYLFEGRLVTAPQDGILNTENQLDYKINGVIHQKEASANPTINLGFENPSRNRYYVQLTLTDLSGKTVYQSKLVKPGYAIPTATLDGDFSVGSHQLTATFTAYSIQTLEVEGDLSCTVVVEVGE